jgi:hypothetical protein
MKTTAQLNREYDAIQQKALKNKLLNNSINDTMKIKPTRLVKTDKQAESALIVFFSMIASGILLAVTIISHYL